MTERGEGPPDPNEMLERLQRMQSEAEETLRRFDEMNSELGADAVEVFSEDGLVRVKLDANGRVDEVGIDEAAMRQRQTLGNTIVELIREASATYGLRMAEMAQSLAGDKVDVSAIMDRYMPQDMRDRARDNLDGR
ncbi:YbaB/EbfC family nucleoid-associated protein [Glycomyces xiaoerkulensis]|uniref:YbaB/EbfC family nucleoid-associated protein n=1 Tax=Glycomyces xiaoerkulensis TaxID=2038139 RepID=UPI000C258B01|nr:YbaB/EbfC family nucleoid-associated protein [Glycomyces xiaoerkulensis]